MSDELTTSKPAVFVPRKTGLAAKKAAVAALTINDPKPIDPIDMQHRIGIIFDDSISMGPKQNEDAIAGTEEFLRSCSPKDTAVAIKPLNKDGLQLTANLPAVAIYVKGIRSSGGTPLVSSLTELLRNNRLTRAIVFSDGEPARYSEEEYATVVEFHLPVDTVYIPDNVISERAEEFMRKLAEDTGGIYLRFQQGKSNFRTAFKYLSPGLRYMLMDKSFVAKLEGR